MELAEMVKIKIDGTPVPLSALVEAWELKEPVEETIAVEAAKTKTVDGKARPMADFLVVEKADLVSTWHLPVKVNGKIDHRLMGAAWAALHSGSRGNVYEGPDKAKAIAELKKLYAAEEMPLPGTKEVEVTMDGNIAEIEYLGDAIIAELGEAEVGHAVQLSEEQAGTWDGVGPLRIDVVMIEPGAGNKKDSHWYPREVLKRDAHVFEGGKMFATDHRSEERNARTEVADILKCPIAFTETGAPIARIGIFDPEMARKVYNRHELGTLGNLHTSIVGEGTSKKAKIEGNEYKVIQEITKGTADFVSYAGAGGHAAAIAEQEQEPMTDPKVEPVVEPQVEEEQEPEVKFLEKEAVKTFLSELEGVPEQVKTALEENEYESEDAIREAAKNMVNLIKAVTGSGDVTGNDEQPVPEAKRSLEEHDKALDAIDKRYGL